MKHRLHLADFTAQGCCLKTPVSGNRAVVEYTKPDDRLVLTGDPGQLGGADWSAAGFLAADVMAHTETVLTVVLNFWDRDNPGPRPDAQVWIGIMPRLKTRISFTLESFNAQSAHQRRTPGRLTSIYWGPALKTFRLNRFAIGTAMGANMDYTASRKLEIFDLWLTDAEPDYPLPDVKLVDELGQLTTRDWPGKTQGAGELKDYLNDELATTGNTAFFKGWSGYGGWRELTFEATGFFRTHHDGKRWWLVDPEGNAFFSTGVDCVRPGEPCRVGMMEKYFSWLPDTDGEFADAWHKVRPWVPGEPDREVANYDFAVSNLIRAFGRQWRDSWAAITKNRLMQWGFNTVANWSDLKFARSCRLPYVIPLNGFPSTEQTLFRDFPDVYSSEYRKNAGVYARQLEAFTGDRFLIGYFMRNEPPWALNGPLYVVQQILASDKVSDTRRALIAFLSERYQGDIIALNKAWGTRLSGFEQLLGPVEPGLRSGPEAVRDLGNFAGIMVDKYVGIPAAALRATDPHHLNLGMRFACVSAEHLEMLFMGHEHYDVYSLNYYKDDPAPVLKRAAEVTGKPLMIGEFHFGALDRGLVNPGLFGVASQAARGRAYTRYLHNGAAVPHCVGIHYFQLDDQPVAGRGDGENFQIGIVDVCSRPYKEFVAGITEANRDIYRVAGGI